MTATTVQPVVSSLLLKDEEKEIFLRVDGFALTAGSSPNLLKDEGMYMYVKSNTVKMCAP